MEKLSVVIITFNEEKNIGRCLEAVREVADDIVVVDSFSGDNTEKICRASGARFVQHKFEGHIEQKNYAITQALFPLILSLDADEVLSPELAAEISQIKNSRNADGYQLNRLTNYSGTWIRHCGWYPDWQLRLWNSAKGNWGGVNPHDKFQMHQGSKIEKLKGDLLHYSYNSKQDHLNQIEKFSSIAAGELFKKGKTASWFHLYLKPVWKFVAKYFLHLGFLDGAAGYSVCRLSAYDIFLRYKKLKLLQKATQK